MCHEHALLLPLCMRQTARDSVIGDPLQTAAASAFSARGAGGVGLNRVEAVQSSDIRPRSDMHTHTPAPRSLRRGAKRHRSWVLLAYPAKRRNSSQSGRGGSVVDIRVRVSGGNQRRAPKHPGAVAWDVFAACGSRETRTKHGGQYGGRNSLQGRMGNDEAGCVDD